MPACADSTAELRAGAIPPENREIHGLPFGMSQTEHRTRSRELLEDVDGLGQDPFRRSQAPPDDAVSGRAIRHLWDLMGKVCRDGVTENHKEKFLDGNTGPACDNEGDSGMRACGSHCGYEPELSG